MRYASSSSSVESATQQQSKTHRFTKHSQNVMEALVAEEVEQQLQTLPHKISRTINPAEVTAFALNRLPGLYATSKRGWQRQWQRGKGELHSQIATAVRQGIMAVQRDPLRSDSPLKFAEDDAAAIALQELKLLLRREDLAWDQVAGVVKQTLLDTMRGKITWAAQADDLFDWERYPHHQRG